MILKYAQNYLRQIKMEDYLYQNFNKTFTRKTGMCVKLPKKFIKGLHLTERDMNGYLWSRFLFIKKGQPIYLDLKN